MTRERPAPAPSHPRSNRQRVRTRTALMTAAQRLFASRPLDSITIDDIVNTADVAKGSFYNHFSGKDALADAIFELVRGDVEFHVLSANRGVDDPGVRLARAMCTVIHYGYNHSDRLQAMLALHARGTGASDPFYAGLSANLRDAAQERRLSAIDVETGLLVVFGLTNIALQHIFAKRPQAVDVLATAMTAAMLRALGMEQAEAQAIADAGVADIFCGGDAA